MRYELISNILYRVVVTYKLVITRKTLKDYKLIDEYKHFSTQGLISFMFELVSKNQSKPSFDLVLHPITIAQNRSA